MFVSLKVEKHPNLTGCLNLLRFITPTIKGIPLHTDLCQYDIQCPSFKNTTCLSASGKTNKHVVLVYLSFRNLSAQNVHF